MLSNGFSQPNNGQGFVPAASASQFSLSGLQTLQSGFTSFLDTSPTGLNALAGFTPYVATATSKSFTPLQLAANNQLMPYQPPLSLGMSFSQQLAQAAMPQTNAAINTAAQSNSAAMNQQMMMMAMMILIKKLLSSNKPKQQAAPQPQPILPNKEDTRPRQTFFEDNPIDENKVPKSNVPESGTDASRNDLNKNNPKPDEPKPKEIKPDEFHTPDLNIVKPPDNKHKNFTEPGFDQSGQHSGNFGGEQFWEGGQHQANRGNPQQPGSGQQGGNWQSSGNNRSGGRR